MKAAILEKVEHLAVKEVPDPRLEEGGGKDMHTTIFLYERKAEAYPNVHGHH